MWLIHTPTNEHGWYICQENQREPCDLLVFVKEGNIWRMKLWNSKNTRIRAKNHKEEVRDDFYMIQSGFRLGFVKSQYEDSRL